MVHVEATSAMPSRNLLSDKDSIYCAPIQLVDEWQTAHTGVCGVQTCITHDLFAPVFDHAAGPADLLSCTQHGDLERWRIFGRL